MFNHYIQIWSYIVVRLAKVRELKYVASSDSIVIGKSLYSTRRLILKIHTGFSVLGKWWNWLDLMGQLKASNATLGYIIYHLKSNVYYWYGRNFIDFVSSQILLPEIFTFEYCIKDHTTHCFIRLLYPLSCTFTQGVISPSLPRAETKYHPIMPLYHGSCTPRKWQHILLTRANGFIKITGCMPLGLWLADSSRC